MKKVSVIIPCYNQGKYVEEAINSVINQTYSNIEIICINDCSTDNSSEIITELCKKYKNIVFLDEKENLGVVKARNKAISIAQGEYILPLDADDTIEPSYIEKAVKILEENPKIGIVYCNAKLFGDIDEIWNLEDFDKSKIIFENQIFNSALFRKSDFTKIGGYKDYMSIGYEDWDLWLSFIEKGFEVYKINEILFNYRQHNIDSRNKTAILKYKQIQKSILNHHTELFKNNEEVINKLYYSFSQEKYEKTNTRRRQFKKLFTIFLILSIVELLIVILLLLFIK